MPRLVIYHFLYEAIKPMYADRLKLLYSDTDSLVLEIARRLIKISRQFQANLDSQFVPKTTLCTMTNKKRLKMKNETHGEFINEYVGLKAMIYNISTRKNCKG